MQQIKIGNDICLISRIASVYERFGEKFLKKILTSSEIAYVKSHPDLLTKRLAGRFAAKEAAAKVLGTGLKGVGWREIEVLKKDSGAPYIKLHGRAATVARKLNLHTWELSISHDGDYAAAFVLAYNFINDF